MTKADFNILLGEHPIVPIMLGDVSRTAKFAERMLEKDVYVIPCSATKQGAHPNPDQRRALSCEDLELAVTGLIEVGREMSLEA